MNIYEAMNKLNENTFNEENNPLEGIRSNILDFPSGDYVYLDYKDGRLIAGSATNTGIIPEFSMKYDHSKSVDGNILDLYDIILETHPEYLKESCSKKNTGKKLTESESAEPDWVEEGWREVHGLDAIRAKFKHISSEFNRGINLNDLSFTTPELAKTLRKAVAYKEMIEDFDETLDKVFDQYWSKFNNGLVEWRKEQTEKEKYSN